MGFIVIGVFVLFYHLSLNFELDQLRSRIKSLENRISQPTK